jgi:lipopolysaccharide biosynthesis glycosyltransferase
MNLQLQRQLVSEREIYDFVEKYRTKLIMPDQDIMNALYSSKIKPLDEKLYNYDVRRYAFYRIRSGGQCDMDFVFDHTVILHFCGRKKPWLKGYSGKFHALYKHYERLAMRG